MGTKTAAVTAAVQQFPLGTTAPEIYQYQVFAEGSTTPVQSFQKINLNSTTLTLPDGTYTLSVHRITSTGTPLHAPAVSAPFTVLTPTVGISVPVSVTVA